MVNIQNMTLDAVVPAPVSWLVRHTFRLSHSLIFTFSSVLTSPDLKAFVAPQFLVKQSEATICGGKI